MKLPDPTACVAVVGASGVLEIAGDTSVAHPWASITKILTALAVLVASEEGAIGLDDAAGPPGSTVRHLLAHASGLDFDADRVLAAPGTRRIYSNTGYETLAVALERATGIAFETYLGEAVLQPLALTSTQLRGTAAAGLHGPLDDLLRVVAELTMPTLLAPETAALMHGVAFPGLGGVLPGFGMQEPNDWALGPELRGHKSPHWTGRHNSPRTFGHFGGGGGFLWLDPEARLACASLSGRAFGPWAVAAWPRLSDEVLAAHARPPR
ncbi:MAG: hypothetical protein QOI47_381 [Actinomycetota bacterium]|nr:hypothetical protein [Actinomycetota bacterium]